jgi:hypothetical protein
MEVLSDRGSLSDRALESGLSEGFPPVGECAHRSGLAVTEREYISQARAVPSRAVSKPHPRVNQHDDHSNDVFCDPPVLATSKKFMQSRVDTPGMSR